MGQRRFSQKFVQFHSTGFRSRLTLKMHGAHKIMKNRGECKRKILFFRRLPQVPLPEIQDTFVLGSVSVRHLHRRHGGMG